MAPNSKNDSLAAIDEDEWDAETIQYENEKPPPPMKIVWRNVIFFAVLHLFALYGVYLSFTSAMRATIVWAYVLHPFSAIGVICGAHRMWSHRGYKGTLGWRIFLMLLNSLAFQNDILEWSRDHRLHHKYSETDADPHNARRGFFFAHIGWLLVRKHPDVIEKGKGIDVSDLWADPVVSFQRRHYFKMLFIWWFAIPTIVPMYYWGETFKNSIFLSVFMRYAMNLNATWLVNSAAHLWGSTPYDQSINPRESPLVIALGGGEGWHNYHHTFPMDYKASEIPYFMSIMTGIIDLAYSLGLAYDLKEVPKEVIEKRRMRTGNLMHHHHH